MQLGHLLTICSEKKDQRHRGSKRFYATFATFEELFPGKRFIAIFLNTLEDRFDAGRILKEFVILFLAALERWDGMIGSQLRSHFREN